MAQWAAMTGSDSDALSAAALALAQEFAGRGIAVAGFVQQSELDDQGHKHIEALRLGSGDRVRLATHGSPGAQLGVETFCSLTLYPEAFAAARQWLQDGAGAPLQLLDSLGKLEVQGRGHAAALAEALTRPGVVVFAARAGQLGFLMERLQLPEASMVGALDLDDPQDQRREFAAAVVAALGLQP